MNFLGNVQQFWVSTSRRFGSHVSDYVYHIVCVVELHSGRWGKHWVGAKNQP